MAAAEQQNTHDHSNFSLNISPHLPLNLYMYADMLTPARDSYMVLCHYKVAMPAGVVSAQGFVTAKNADPLLAGYKFYINGDFVDLGPGTSDVNNIDDSSTSGGFFC